MKKRLLESRWVYLLLSIVLAVLFWLYVQTTTDPERTTWYNNVPVNQVGSSVLTSQGLTVSGLSTDQVRLQITAPASIHRDLLDSRSSLAVTVDVSRCTEGENQLTITPVWPSSINTDRLSLDARDPAIVTATVEKLYTRTLDVTFRLQGKVASGYQVGTPAISPSSVIVSGPVEQVSQVSEVAAILNEDDLDSQFSGDLPLTLLDSEGNELTGLEVTLDSPTAYVVLPIVVVKEVDLSVALQAGGGAVEDNADVTIDPPSIMVSGSEEALAGLTEISLGSVDLARVVGSNSFTFPINLDPSLENVTGISNATVQVTIHGLSTRTFEVSNITPINVPEGYTATPITQAKTVTVRGTQEILETIDASQIRIDVDLSRVTVEGISSVPARVYLDSTDTVGVIGEYYVSVNMSR